MLLIIIPFFEGIEMKSGIRFFFFFFSTSFISIFSLGCALTYVTINKELWMVAATYGFVSAFGQNIALIPTLTTAMKWFPNRKGTAMGVVVGGFGGGAMVFNQVQTAIVNFENYNV